MKRLEPVILADDRDPWDRQDGETPRRYAQFLVYRDLGRTRTLRQTAENLTRNADHVRHVASAGMWRERATAWDYHLDDLYAAQMVDARRTAAEQDAKIVNAMKTRVVAALTRITGDDLEAHDVAKWARVILSARAGLFGADVAALAGGALAEPSDPIERRLAGYDSADGGEGIAEVKTLEMERVDRLQSFLWPAARAGDVAAVRAIERLMGYRARLMGLFSPTKVEKVVKSELDAELERLMAGMRLDLPPAPRDAL